LCNTCDQPWGGKALMPSASVPAHLHNPHAATAKTAPVPAGRSAGREAERVQGESKSLENKRLHDQSAKVASKLRWLQTMKSYIHDIVRRLLELHGLEERLAALRRDPDERANAEALIESLRANLPMGVLIVHDQMRARGKRSVAEVRRGVCSGCHLALGFGNVAALRGGDMRRCGNCGRYVYLVDEVEADLAPPAKPKRKVATRTARLVSNSR